MKFEAIVKARVHFSMWFAVVVSPIRGREEDGEGHFMERGQRRRVDYLSCAGGGVRWRQPLVVVDCVQLREKYEKLPFLGQAVN